MICTKRVGQIGKQFLRCEWKLKFFKHFHVHHVYALRHLSEEWMSFSPQRPSLSKISTGEYLKLTIDNSNHSDSSSSKSSKEPHHSKHGEVIWQSTCKSKEGSCDKGKQEDPFPAEPARQKDQLFWQILVSTVQFAYKVCCVYFIYLFVSYACYFGHLFIMNLKSYMHGKQCKSENAQSSFF